MEGIPPPGTRPDHDRGPSVNIVIWIGFAVSSIFVLARLFTRSFISRNFGWDDGLMALSLIVNFVLTVLTSAGCIANGLGRHLEYVPPDQITSVLYYSAIIQPLGVFCFCTPKLSVAILIVSIMGPKKRGRWFLYAIVAVLYVIGIISFIVLFAQCDPPSHFWHPLEPAECISPLILQNITIAVASWSAFVDLCLAVYPITIFWDLQLKKSKKISMSVLMGVGVLAMICAIVKSTTLDSNHDPDFTYAFPDLVIWTLVEIDAVLIAACVPVMPRLFSFIMSGGKRDASNYAPNSGYKSFGSSGNKSTLATNKTVNQGVELESVHSTAGIVKSVQMEQSWDTRHV